MGFNRCFCCNLRTGTVVLGLLGVVVHTVYIMSSVIGLCKVDYIAKLVIDLSGYYSIEHWILGIEVFLKCFFVFSFINLIAAFILILGVIKENRYLLLPWLIGEFILTLFTIILFVSIFYILGYYYLMMVAWLAIGCTFSLWLCVYSLFVELGFESMIDGSTTALLRNKPASTPLNYHLIP